MENIKIKINQDNWNKTYTQFEGWCALPTWGPYEVCKDDPTLIGDIKDKIFLEMCCGSGHSIKYLIENGAKKVYEKLIELPEKVDVVFSVYGIGWTLDPASTFKNIFSYLKSGGKFVWSWDHGVFLNSQEQDGKVVVTGSYYDESEHHLETFYSGEGVYQAFRKTSTWFQFLRDAGFEINRYLEPKPININEDISTISSPEMGKYYSPVKAEKIPPVIVFECFKK